MTNGPTVMSEASSSPTVESYRAVSVLAVLSLLAGLLALLALPFPVLLWVPVAGALLGWGALRRIRGAEGQLTGRRLAQGGLALSVFVLCGLLGRSVVEHALLLKHGRRHADQWLQLVASGHRPEAHQLTLLRYNRQPPGTDLKHYYRTLAPDEAAELRTTPEGGEYPLDNLQKFFAKEPVEALEQALLDGAQPEHVASRRTPPALAGTDRVEVVYELRGEKFVLVLVRYQDVYTSDVFWHLDDVLRAGG
jgi:hypothetical protein